MSICKGVEREGESMTEGAICPGPQTKGGGGKTTIEVKSEYL